MRLNYDQTLPKIAEELTGSKGEKVNFGEHKNAFNSTPASDNSEYTREYSFLQARRNAGELTYEQFLPLEQALIRKYQGKQPRSDLIFRNPDGTPKTDITARMYDISNTPSKFSATGRRFQEQSNVDKYNPQIDTPEFKKWFGDSKVVDENGKPLVVYHGSRINQNIGIFDRSKGKILDHGYFGQGIYLTDNPRAAESYARQWNEPGYQYGPIYPVYVSIKNPANRKILEKLSTEFSTYSAFRSMDESKRVTQLLKEQGYDGIIISNPTPHPYGSVYGSLDELGGYSIHPEIVVFRPEQIKSATGNAGTFDATNPDIRFQPGSNIVDKIPDEFRDYNTVFHYRKFGEGAAGSYWMNPYGVMVPVRDHLPFAKEYQKVEVSRTLSALDIYQKMYDMGWKRMVVNDRGIYVDAPTKPSGSILRNLIQNAEQFNRDAVIWDSPSRRPVILWENRGNPNDDGVRWQPFSNLLETFKPEIDKIAALNHPNAPVIARAFTKFYENKDRFVGQFNHEFFDKLDKHLNKLNPIELFTLDNEKFRRVVQRRWDLQDYQASTINLTPEEREIDQALTDVLAKTLAAKNAVPGFKFQAPNPNYIPMIPSRSTIKTLLNEPGPKRDQLIQDWHDYYTGILGKTQAESDAALDTYMKAYDKRFANLAQQFGPIDKASGLEIGRAHV